MTKEHQIVDSRRDSSHEFAGWEGMCVKCGKPRWHHVLDGFKPGNPPSMLSWQSDAIYRGPHPAWRRPGSFSRMERKELEAEQRLERQRIERAIAGDQAAFAARRKAGST